MAKQKQKQSATSEFRKDVVELMVEALGRRLGKQGFSALPDAIKEQLVKMIGGPDGVISDQQIAMLAIIPKFLFSGTLSEEAGQSFVRSVGEALRAYSLNPHADRDQRRSAITRIMDGAVMTEEKSSSVTDNKKLNLFMRMGTLSNTEMSTMVDFLAQIHKDNAPHVYQAFEAAGRTRLVDKESLKLVLKYLENGHFDMAFEELLSVLRDAPLLNPPEDPSKIRTWIKKAFDSASASLDTYGADTVEHIIASGETLETIARHYKIEELTIRRLNDLSQDLSTQILLTDGEALRVFQGPLNEPFRTLERKAAEYCLRLS